jgi:hypothetical protein
VIPDLSVLWVIALLMLCVFVLNTLIFKPILHVIESRSGAVRDARSWRRRPRRRPRATEQFDRIGPPAPGLQADGRHGHRARQTRRHHGDTKREADAAFRRTSAWAPGISRPRARKRANHLAGGSSTGCWAVRRNHIMTVAANRSIASAPGWRSRRSSRCRSSPPSR